VQCTGIFLARPSASVAPRYMVAALRIGKKRFVPPGDPLHGPTQPARSPPTTALLRIVLALVRRPPDQHRANTRPSLPFVDAELLASVSAGCDAASAAAIERVAGGNRTASLDGSAAQPVCSLSSISTFARRLSERTLTAPRSPPRPGEARFRPSPVAGFHNPHTTCSAASSASLSWDSAKATLHQ